eukprot:g2442.t1
MSLRCFDPLDEPAIVEPEDGGAIVVVSVSKPTPSSFSATLRLKPEACLEAAGSFKQWFCFEAQSMPVGPGTVCEFVIEDAGDSTYPEWGGYKCCMSRDGGTTWDRVADTTFEGGALQWRVPDNTSPVTTFAYFPTYGLARQRLLVHSVQATGLAKHRILGKTLDGRPIHALVFGAEDEKEKKKHVIWMQHRQHPGEVAASFFCDGAVRRLLEMAKSGDSALLKTCLVVVVPNCNPDGGVRGHLRTNAAGANLNRCWGGLHPPVLDAEGKLQIPPGQSDPPAPETEALIGAMKALGGVDLMFDIHQDEEKPYVFISKTPLGVKSCTPAMRDLHESFRALLRKRSPDFMTPGDVVEPVGYPEPAPGKANLAICSAAVAEAFPGCLSMTMEMPYKGNVNAGPAAAEGWTVQQCADLGVASVNAVEDVLPELLRSR